MKKTGISITVKKKNSNITWNPPKAVERNDQMQFKPRTWESAWFRDCDLPVNYLTFRSSSFIICNLGIEISAYPRDFRVN